MNGNALLPAGHSACDRLCRKGSFPMKRAVHRRFSPRRVPVLKRLVVSASNFCVFRMNRRPEGVRCFDQRTFFNIRSLALSFFSAAAKACGAPCGPRGILRAFQASHFSAGYPWENTGKRRIPRHGHSAPIRAGSLPAFPAVAFPIFSGGSFPFPEIRSRLKTHFFRSLFSGWGEGENNGKLAFVPEERG